MQQFFARPHQYQTNHPKRYFKLTNSILFAISFRVPNSLKRVELLHLDDMRSEHVNEHTRKRKAQKHEEAEGGHRFSRGLNPLVAGRDQLTSLNKNGEDNK